MNANAIQEKILSDARTSASDIMRDANEKAARLRDAGKADGCRAQPPDDAGF